MFNFLLLSLKLFNFLSLLAWLLNNLSKTFALLSRFPSGRNIPCPARELQFFLRLHKCIAVEFHIWHYAESKTSHLTAWREAANVAISALWGESPLAFFCALPLNASPGSHTRPCKHLPWCSKQLLSTQADDLSSRSLCTEQQRRLWLLLHIYIYSTTIFPPPPSCFPSTQKTLLIKVIPQCCYSVGMRQRHADCQVKQDLETILMVCLSWWSNVTSRPFHAGESLNLGTWVLSQAKENEVLNVSAIAPSTRINPQQSPQG